MTAKIHPQNTAPFSPIGDPTLVISRPDTPITIHSHSYAPRRSREAEVALSRALAKLQADNQKSLCERCVIL